MVFYLLVWPSNKYYKICDPSYITCKYKYNKIICYYKTFKRKKMKNWVKYALLVIIKLCLFHFLFLVMINTNFKKLILLYLLIILIIN